MKAYRCRACGEANCFSGLTDQTVYYELLPDEDGLPVFGERTRIGDPTPTSEDYYECGNCGEGGEDIGELADIVEVASREERLLKDDDEPLTKPDAS